MFKLFFIALLSFLLIACANLSKSLPPAKLSELQQGKRYFVEGYYKSALRNLLPLACEGIPEAQYAIGYMYYYGYGVAQDTDVGYFWIKRAADQKYPPAINALQIITSEQNRRQNLRERIKD